MATVSYTTSGDMNSFSQSRPRFGCLAGTFSPS